MNITNEKLYEMILDIKSEQTQIRVEQSQIRTEQAQIRAELKSDINEVKTAQSELRADITKWGVGLFVGSMITITSILGVFIASILLTIGQ